MRVGLLPRFAAHFGAAHEAQDTFVVGLEGLAASGTDVGGDHRGGEKGDGQQHRSHAVQAGEGVLPKSKLMIGEIRDATGATRVPCSRRRPGALYAAAIPPK